MEEIGVKQRNRPFRAWENRSRSRFFQRYLVNWRSLGERQASGNDRARRAFCSSRSQQGVNLAPEHRRIKRLEEKREVAAHAHRSRCVRKHEGSGTDKQRKRCEREHKTASGEISSQGSQCECSERECGSKPPHSATHFHLSRAAGRECPRLPRCAILDS